MSQCRYTVVFSEDEREDIISSLEAVVRHADADKVLNAWSYEVDRLRRQIAKLKDLTPEPVNQAEADSLIDAECLRAGIATVSDELLVSVVDNREFSSSDTELDFQCCDCGKQVINSSCLDRKHVVKLQCFGSCDLAVPLVTHVLCNRCVVADRAKFVHSSSSVGGLVGTPEPTEGDLFARPEWEQILQGLNALFVSRREMGDHSGCGKLIRLTNSVLNLRLAALGSEESNE